MNVETEQSNEPDDEKQTAEELEGRVPVDTVTGTLQPPCANDANCSVYFSY